MSAATSRLIRGFSSGLVMALLLSTAATQPVRSEDRPTIPVLVKDQSTYFWKVVLAGAEAVGRDLKVKVIGKSPPSEQDAAGEIALIQETMKEKPTAIVIAPTQYSAPGPAVDEAAKQAPVVVIDSSVASLNMKATLSTDNVKGGRLAADALAKAITEKYGTTSGEVAIVNYLSGAGSVTERSKGFKDQLFAKYPHLSVVDERDGNGTNSVAKQNVASVLQSRPNLRGVFATNLNTAEAAGAAFKSAGISDKTKLVGFDSDDKLISYLSDGTIAALVVQDPYRMGYDGVKTAYEASQGRGVLQYIDTGANIITRDNMNGDREKQLLHPAIN